MLNYLKMGRRVMLGFIFVLGLLLAVSFIGRHVMADAIDRVEKANALNDLITGILQARIDEKAFIQNETETNISSVLTHISRLRVQSTNLEAQFEEQEDISQIVLVETKLVEYLKAFLTYVNTKRLGQEAIFFMQQTSASIIRNTNKVSNYLDQHFSEIKKENETNIQIASLITDKREVIGKSPKQIDLGLAMTEKIIALSALLSETKIHNDNITLQESELHSDVPEKNIESLVEIMQDLKATLNGPEITGIVDENIHLMRRYRQMIIVFNNLNRMQISEHQRMIAAADAMQLVCNTTSIRQNDVMKKKISFAHRISLVFILGGVLMGLLIGLLVTVRIKKTLNKIKAVEMALRESDERFELVLEATTDGVWDWDVPTDKAYCSPTYYAMLGYRPEEILPMIWKRLWLDLIHPDDRRDAIKAVHAHIEKRDDSYELEFRMRHKSGRYIWIYDRGRVTQRDQQGRPIRVVGTLVDISKRKQMEQDLKHAKEAAEAANKAKSLFLANMSHELRTPLNSVLGFSQMMRRDPTTTKSQSENLDIINKSGEHLLNLINDVLDMSKIEAGRIFLEPEKFDLSNMIMDIADMMQHRAQSKGLRLRIDRSSRLPRYIYGDQAKMRQILINLLSNAIKYTEKGNVILRLSSTALDNGNKVQLHMEVEDRGIGISPEDRKKIFEPFEQAIKNVDSVRGTGLGLAITRQYVELMSGQISVKSQLGQGSVFRVDIPVETITDQAIKDIASPLGPVIALEDGQPQYRILIVEDNLNSRILLRKILERVGFVVREAVNGQEAIDIFTKFQPHLIWMDRRLPLLNGLEATKQIKKLKSGRNTIIVALTASVFKEQKNEVIAAGCDDFVSKPFQEYEILETMARHLGVRYRYQKTGSDDSQNENDKLSYHLMPEELKSLPQAWIKTFKKAVRAAQGDVAIESVESLDSKFTLLAQKLKHLIENYRFDMIVAWIDGIDSD